MDNITVILSGIVGSLVCAVVGRVNSFKQTCVIVFVGTSVATFGVPLVCELSTIDCNVNIISGMGFLGGIIGMGITKATIEKSNNVVDKVLGLIIKKTNGAKK